MNIRMHITEQTIAGSSDADIEHCCARFDIRCSDEVCFTKCGNNDIRAR